LSHRSKYGSKLQIPQEPTLPRYHSTIGTTCPSPPNFYFDRFV
jgi:hypothetical protein